MKGIGVDIASRAEIARLIERCERETLTLVFTNQEQNSCQSVSDSPAETLSDRLLYYALCFGVKEAVGKALGSGLVGIDWNEIETDLTKAQPVVRLYGQAKTQAQSLGIQQWLVDWWEWQDCVLVHVLALCEEQINE
ncbi:4'-phosphopantetheinyl transferase superfamily protein [Pleurocapsales cyanobacterium LEGE 06147]|nr:4'-phosphopantetheinyl transferase superfamily protein [Pleurocapsales cyanobacterium LEGE 06147]